MELTSRQRIMNIFKNEPIDRPALKLWGAVPGDKLLHPSYGPVMARALELTDLFVLAHSPFEIYCGAHTSELEEHWLVDTPDPLWKDQHIRMRTPMGDLHAIYRISTIGDPSYTIEHFIKEPADIKKLLSMPYEPFPFDARDYHEKVAALGERGVVLLCLDHAAYALQRMIGPENLAYFSVDCRELLFEAVDVFSKRIRAFTRDALAAGLKCPFYWVGPEAFTPPLMSPNDFDQFVYAYDKPLCDDIRDAGGHVWVHCHGKVANFIERFIRMGVDVLNPLEPPKNGDIDLAKIIEKYSNRIGWEGNIEIQEILQSEPERLRALIYECVEAGAKSGRFILCPSAGFMEYARPEQRYIDNLLLYLEYGYECVNALRY